jgi:hypothetical protein
VPIGENPREGVIWIRRVHGDCYQL